ncbi:MAG: zonular occludens toxin domain-containing protein [Polaromonas sp.]
MAINAYTGLMGSGKSYEVVENIILPALASGRRVVTNVANLQIEDINAYLQESQGIAPQKLGQIVQVQNDDLEKDNFFPVELLPGQMPIQSVVQPGDLVVVDECWRWWSSGSKIMSAHMVFFRMHRHFVNQETKATCDLVLVVQDISDLDRKLKVVVENTYRMSKHKSLGMTTRYRVDIYASYRTTRVPYRSLQRKYNPDIFKLYQSYSQAGGKSGNEVPIDDRANIFKGALFRVFFADSVSRLWRMHLASMAVL